MAFLPLLAATLSIPMPQEPHRTPPPSRFEVAAPLPGIRSVKLDSLTTGFGLANEMARAKGLQGRILWIDGTANLDRVNSEEKIVALVAQIKRAGFNTIVFDVKPISGQTLYPSKIAPKITEWRGRTLPVDFDPLAPMVREARAHALDIYVSLNAFSEGHNMFKAGPGYDKPEWQSVTYETKPQVGVDGSFHDLVEGLNRLVDGRIGVFNDTRRIPEAKEGRFTVTLDRNRRVVDGFEMGGVGQGVPTLPNGGVALVGDGDPAEFLRRIANPGARLEFKGEPLFLRTAERPEAQFPLMMNPNHPEVQEYALSIVRELLAGYDLDGIVYDDRYRYAGINADFSELTRAKFEAHVGKKLAWPDDVFRFTLTPNLVRGIEPGPFYDAWMAFRARVLQDFLARVRETVAAARPSAQVGLYVGSWYGEYPALGNNYASTEFDAGFWFLTPEYRQTGMAPLLDFLMTGCYYVSATIYDAMAAGVGIGASVEAAGQLSNHAARDQTWTYAGIALDRFKGNPEGLEKALQAACGSTQGVMVFDLSHDIEPMWSVFERAFEQPKAAPHRVPGLTDELRRRRAEADKNSARRPPVVIAAGSAGTGH